MKKLFACLTIVGTLGMSTLVVHLPNVAFILTVIFGGPFTAQVGIGIGTLIAAILLGVDPNTSFVLGL